LTYSIDILCFEFAPNERGLALWRYSVFRQPGATTPDQL